MATPNFTTLLQDAVNKPGSIMQAYSAFHHYSLGNQLLESSNSLVVRRQPPRLRLNRAAELHHLADRSYQRRLRAQGKLFQEPFQIEEAPGIRLPGATQRPHMLAGPEFRRACTAVVHAAAQVHLGPVDAVEAIDPCQELMPVPDSLRHQRAN